ncbi:MAG: DUF1566 domain-containing protein, partial [Dissulfuribacterales bacterium]
MKHRWFFGFVVAAVLAAFSWGQAQAVVSTSTTITLPRTGQTTSYAAGDDGALQMGATLPTPRFKDNGDGTVTDNLTGLVWLKNANCFSRTTWSGALAATNGLADGQCGLMDGSHAGDWRLPNDIELWSLIDFQYYAPALSNTAGTGKWSAGHPFTGVQSTYYWSSTTVADSTVQAWIVSFWYGSAWSSKNSTYYVWPVRGGQSGSFYNLTISKAGTGSGSITATGCTLSWSGNTGTCRA